MTYVLNANGVATAEPDFVKWAKWMEEMDNRTVAVEEIEDAKVSTVFLGLNHRFGKTSGPPILWETMVFGGSMDETQERCSGTREQAEAMHADMVERVRAVEALKH